MKKKDAVYCLIWTNKRNIKNSHWRSTENRYTPDSPRSTHSNISGLIFCYLSRTSLCLNDICVCSSVYIPHVFECVKWIKMQWLYMNTSAMALYRVLDTLLCAKWQLEGFLLALWLCLVCWIKSWVIQRCEGCACVYVCVSREGAGFRVNWLKQENRTWSDCFVFHLFRRLPLRCASWSKQENNSWFYLWRRTSKSLSQHSWLSNLHTHDQTLFLQNHRI